MSARKSAGGSGELAPFGSLKPGDDGITIPKIPEGAVRVGGPTVVVANAAVTNFTAKTAQTPGKGCHLSLVAATNEERK
jgi:hypothetical protein